MNRHRVSCLAASITILLATGCLIAVPPPPFNATGVYQGLWGGVTESGGDAFSCPATITLEQDNFMFSAFDYEVWGTVQLNLTCRPLIDELAAFDLPAGADIEVQGLMTPAGQLLLGSQNIEQSDSLNVELDLEGTDLDDDGEMDTLEGDLTLYVDGNEVRIEGTFAQAT